MITTLVLIVHVIVCIALILIILLQTGKGADIGAAFGGGSTQTVFGSTGATSFLSRVTIGAAVVFMITSFVLTYISGRMVTTGERSLMTEQSAVPIEEQVPGAPAPQAQGEKQEAAPQSSQPAVPSGAEKAAPPTGAPAEQGAPAGK